MRTGGPGGWRCQMRVAAPAVDDARVRAAEARAREAEHALQAAQTGLAQRIAALDRVQDAADQRERAANQRNHLADERNHLRRPTRASPTHASGPLTIATWPQTTPTSAVGGRKGPKKPERFWPNRSRGSRHGSIAVMSAAYK
jgi:hypothetical protein